MASDSTQRLLEQIAFIREIDQLKSISRKSLLLSRERYENSAEHSWHVAMMALILQEHAPSPVDTARVIRMLLIHDIVEIDAGDVFIYDEAAQEGKADREAEAFRRIFGLLPPEQHAELATDFAEFEAGDSPEAHFARALDRMMPLLHNYYTQGAAWREHDVRAEQVMRINAIISKGSPTLWEFAKDLIKTAQENGWIRP